MGGNITGNDGNGDQSYGDCHEDPRVTHASLLQPREERANGSGQSNASR